MYHQEALRAEKREKDFALNLLKHKTEKGLVEEYREILAGGKKIPLAEAFDLAMAKPRKKRMSPKQLESKRSYWGDFVAFMESDPRDIHNLNDVKKKHAEEYIAYLQAKGRFNKKVTFKQGNQIKEYERQHNISARTVREFYISIL